MPIYEYECPSCKKVHEVMQKFSDDPLKKCPDCGGDVSKLMSLSSFALKGSGWYSTGYHKSSSTSTTTDASAPKSTDSKPEKKESSPAKATSEKKSD